jgi:Tfp pilus assembly protein PilF
MSKRLTALILAMFVLISFLGYAEARTSVLESVTYKREENRTAITFLYNQPTQMVFYTIGNPPQIVADIVGNAFAQSVNVPMEMPVNAPEINNIASFIDPSLGDEHFYGIDFLVVDLKHKVAYTHVKHKNGYTLYVADSPSLSATDIKPKFQKKKEVKPTVSPAQQPESLASSDRGATVICQPKDTVKKESEKTIAEEALAPAINLRVEKKEEIKDSKETFSKSTRDYMGVETNLTCGSADEMPDYRDSNRHITKTSKNESKSKDFKVASKQQTAKDSKPTDFMAEPKKSRGAELEPKNAVSITPASHTENIQLAMHWRQVGYNHQKNKDYDKALSAYNKAAELYPSYACIHNDIGIIFFYLGMYEKALGEFQKAVELDDEYLAAYSNIATVYEETGQKSKAIEYWQKRVDASDANDVWTQKARKKIEDLKRNK